jgi:nitrous oxidase accessory protein
LFIGTSIIPAMAQDTEKQFSGGTWLYVGGSGPGNYTKIQDAIDNASDGDTVFVYDNSSPYHENIAVNTTIQLIGEDKYTTVIDGDGEENIIFIGADNVLIRGFTILGTKNPLFSERITGINVMHAKGCIIWDNNLTANMCISLFYCNNITITGNRVHATSLYDYGIYLLQSTNNVISNNFVYSGHGGIFLISNNSHNIISSNDISGCSFGIVSSENSTNTVIEENIVQHNDIGINVLKSKDNTIHNNYIVSCRIGADIDNSVGTDISQNNVSRCSWYGLLLWYYSHDILVETNQFYSCGLGVYTIGADKSVFRKNNFLYNTEGLVISYSIGVNIFSNSFSGNDYGLVISERSSCVVIKNNFYSNSKSAEFSQFGAFSNTRTYWIRNYWDEPRLTPYFIHGKLILNENQYFLFSIRWINVDWLPAHKPNEIPGIR